VNIEYRTGNIETSTFCGSLFGLVEFSIPFALAPATLRFFQLVVLKRLNDQLGLKFPVSMPIY